MLYIRVSDQCFKHQEREKCQHLVRISAGEVCTSGEYLNPDNKSQSDILSGKFNWRYHRKPEKHVQF